MTTLLNFSISLISATLVSILTDKLLMSFPILDRSPRTLRRIALIAGIITFTVSAAFFAQRDSIDLRVYLGIMEELQKEHIKEYATVRAMLASGQVTGSEATAVVQQKEELEDTILQLEATIDASKKLLATPLPSEVVAKGAYSLSDLFPEDPLFDIEAVTSVTADETGDIWFGGTLNFYGGTASVLRANPSGLETFKLPFLKPAPQAIYDIAIDNRKQKWFATDAGVVMLDPTNNNWQTYQADNTGLASNFVYSVAIDKYGNLWFGTDQGISRRWSGEEEHWVTYDISDNLADNWVRCIVIDNKENIWVGTNKGLSLLRGRSDYDAWTTYTSADGLPGDVIDDIAVDRFGYVWLVIPRKGVTVLGKGNYTTADGLESNFVTAIAVDSKNRKWIGYELGGVSVLSSDNSTWEHFTEPAISGETVTDIAVAPNGDVWIATTSGAMRF